MDMQQAYAGADLGRLEERLAETYAELHKAHARIDSLRNALTDAGIEIAKLRAELERAQRHSSTSG